jgi:hypothetical protein
MPGVEAATGEEIGTKVPSSPNLNHYITSRILEQGRQAAIKKIDRLDPINDKKKIQNIGKVFSLLKYKNISLLKQAIIEKIKEERLLEHFLIKIHNELTE